MQLTFVYLPFAQRYINLLHVSRIEIYDEYERVFMTQPNDDDDENEYSVFTVEVVEQRDRKTLRDALRLLTLNTQELPQ
jgi:hypothetical protein